MRHGSSARAGWRMLVWPEQLLREKIDIVKVDDIVKMGGIAKEAGGNLGRGCACSVAGAASGSGVC